MKSSLTYTTQRPCVDLQDGFPAAPMTLLLMWITFRSSSPLAGIACRRTETQRNSVNAMTVGTRG